MIKPHISIVSSLLPAGNNPNTLEGVVAHEFGDIDRHPQTRSMLALGSLGLRTTVDTDLSGFGFVDEASGIGLRGFGEPTSWDQEDRWYPTRIWEHSGERQH